MQRVCMEKGVAEEIRVAEVSEPTQDECSVDLERRTVDLQVDPLTNRGNNIEIVSAYLGLDAVVNADGEDARAVLAGPDHLRDRILPATDGNDKIEVGGLPRHCALDELRELLRPLRPNFIGQ